MPTSLRRAFSTRPYQLLLDQEISHGHAFLFAPIVIGAGAVAWFAAPFDPPGTLILGLLLTLCCICAASRWRLGRIPASALAALLFLSGAVL
ncbi:MAG TPA: hypothetical protein VHG11_10220, partial [Pseudorhizobium sp.]|nr:hypothetical protein [Pseudorhizobium sp.]